MKIVQTNKGVIIEKSVFVFGNIQADSNHACLLLAQNQMTFRKRTNVYYEYIVRIIYSQVIYSQVFRKHLRISLPIKD